MPDIHETARHGIGGWHNVRHHPIYTPRLLSSRLALVTRGWPVVSNQPGKMPMNSGLRLARSEFAKGRWATEPSLDTPPLHPSELDQISNMRTLLSKRASLAIARFLIVFCIGVGTTLAWQSYGDAARQMIASSSSRLGWLAPPAGPVAQAALAASAGASFDLNQLKAMSRDLAVMRQSVDKLTAEIAKLQVTKQGTLDRASVPPPATVGTAGRKPVPPAPQAR